MSLGTSRYPPRKQLIWSQCQEYLRRNVLLLVQLDNLNSQDRQSFKTQLGQLGLSLKSPKPRILRKVLRLSRHSCLAPAVVGTTALAISNREPGELKAALKFLKTHGKSLLIAGKIGETPFAAEGINDIVCNVPRIAALQASMAELLMLPAQSLVAELQRAPAALASALSQHLAMIGGGGKEREQGEENTRTAEDN